MFDFLWALGDEIQRWAERTRAEVETWTELDPEGKTERGIELMLAAITPPGAAPRGPGPRRAAGPGA